MDRQYVFTERAHLMCPDMFFGISEKILAPFDREKVFGAFNKLAEAHPFLKAVIGYEKESNRFFYDITDSLKAEIIFCDDTYKNISPGKITDITKSYYSQTVSDDEVILDAYKTLTSRDWDIRSEGMLKAIVWRAAEKTRVLFVFHHLLADGRAALSLATEFARLYSSGTECVAAPEQLISEKNELPELPLISKMLINRCNKKWKKEQRRVSFEEYHQFANEYLKTGKRLYEITKIASEDVLKLIGQCRENGISVNDYFLAKMMIEDKTDKVIIAQDLRQQLKCYKPGALGNYSTAMSIICKTKSDNIFTEAKRVHVAVQKMINNPRAAMTVLSCYALMEPELIDAVAISTLGGFRSKVAEFVGTAMFGYKQRNGFSITNLGAFEEESIEDAMFIPPASPAMQKILGILTVNGKTNICACKRELN